MVRAVQMKNVQLRETYCLPDEVILLSLCVGGSRCIWGCMCCVGVYMFPGMYIIIYIYIYIYIYTPLPGQRSKVEFYNRGITA